MAFHRLPPNDRQSGTFNKFVELNESIIAMSLLWHDKLQQRRKLAEIDRHCLEGRIGDISLTHATN